MGLLYQFPNRAPALWEKEPAQHAPRERPASAARIGRLVVEFVVFFYMTVALGGTLLWLLRG